MEEDYSNEEQLATKIPLKQRAVLDYIQSTKSTHTTSQQIHYFHSNNMIEDLVSSYDLLEKGVMLAFETIIKSIKS